MRGVVAILLFSFGTAHLNAAPTSLPTAGAELFTNDSVRRILITIPPEGIAALRTNPRSDVVSIIHEGTNAFERVGIHLKGATGSFRKIDDKPSLTLSFDKSTSSRRFHGLSKIHLNNSVEDPSYLHELIGSEVFRKAGIPAARVIHALVELNGKKLGLYVLKEGFTEDFLRLHFLHPTGNLYEPGEGHDVNESLDRQLGGPPEPGRDLAALAAAVQEPESARRWQQMNRTLDVDRFITFMALEILMGHRDGYCLARNNFRVYHDVDTERMVFFPHGMDQLFGNPRVPVQPRMNGLVAKAIMETREGRQQYRQRCAALMTNILVSSSLTARVDHAAHFLQSVLGPQESAELGREAAGLKDRITQRLVSIDRQLKQAPLELLKFPNGIATLNNWLAVDVPAGGELIQTNTADGKRVLTIQAGPITAASWRSRVLLPRGQYRFEGSLRTAGVVSMAFGKNHGAALRVANASAPGGQRLLGNQPWKTNAISFEITNEEQETDLICELRAARGQAWFDMESLRLVRLK